MYKKALMTILTIFGLLMFTDTTYAQNCTDYINSIDATNLQGYTIHVPSGITTKAILSQEINSQNTFFGQPIYAVLKEDFKYNDVLIAPNDSTVIGSVVSFAKNGISNKKGKIQIKFTTIRTLYNNTIPISATITNIENFEILEDGTIKAKNKNEEVIMSANSEITLIFEQPITLGAH